MLEFTNPFSRDGRGLGVSTSVWKPRQEPRRTTRKTSLGNVDPRRVISREKRKDRVDSKVDGLDGQQDEEAINEYEFSFTALKDKFIASPQLHRFSKSLDRDIEENFAPGACAASLEAFRSDEKPTSLRSLIVLVIAILLVFGALYSLVEYLLLATRASACSVSTVYVPVPYTVTVGSSNSSSIAPASAASNSTSGARSIIYTSTSTQVLTSYVTIAPSAVSSKPPYVYTVDSSGSTDWINGVSPSSGVSLVTATTSIIVSAIPSSDDTRLPSSTQEVESVTVPRYTSTKYSYVGSDITLTSTSTSTNYVTISLSLAGPGSTDTRSSFPGIGSGGWNASTTATSVQPAALSSSTELGSTTLTSIYYQSSGEPTTLTTTTFLTTTILLRHTVTVAPSVSSHEYVTTITALPVTITDQYGSQIASSASTLSSSATISVMSSISTTLNGSLAGPVTASASSNAGVVPVAQSSGSSATLLTESSSRFSTNSNMSSSAPSKQSTSTGIFTNSSFACASSSMQSSTDLSVSSRPGSTPSSLPRRPITSSALITSTMSGNQPLVSHSPNARNSTNPRVTNEPTTSSLPGSTMPSSLSSTISPRASSAGPEAIGFNSSVAPASSGVSISGTSPAISSTLSAVPTSSGVNTIGPVSGSSAASLGNTVQTSLSLQPYNTMPPFNISTGTTTQSNMHTSMRSSAVPVASSSVRPSFRSSQITSIVPVPSSSFTKSSRRTTDITSTRLSRGPKASSSGVSAAATSTNQTSVSSNLESRPSSRPSLVGSTTSSTTVSHPFPASSATAAPTSGCGEHGDFTIDFDNLPNFMPTGPNTTDITQAPPIENPYYHLTFSDGYVYAPQPAEPFSPVSPPHLAVFAATSSGKRVSTPFGNYSKPGEISDGPRKSISAFWFDAYSAFLGCDNPGPSACTLVLSAYTWSPIAKTEIIYDRQNATIDPCPELRECKLQQVSFPDSFRSLSGLQIQAFVGDEEKMFFMDDLALRWSNNTCAAGMLRQSSL